MKKETGDYTLQEHVHFAGDTAIPKIESTSEYQYRETRDLVQLVNEAVDLVHVKGEAAFDDFRLPGSHWRKEEVYVFVLDPDGNMLVHPDPELEGHNQLGLKDINGKPIIHGLIGAATDFPEKPEGWYHYQWYIPGEMVPRWKSSFVKLAKSPSGKVYIVGSGVYNDRMERVFVMDAVKSAVREIERSGKDAFQVFRDPKGPYIVKDTYIFVTDLDGIELVNPAFPNLEGRNQLDLKDTKGKFLNREMIKIVQSSGSGWADYMWPKPGESVSTLKSAYVSKARMGNKEVMVGCGVYLTDAPREMHALTRTSAADLMKFVREAADILSEKGEKALREFRKEGSKWFHDETYLFIYTMDGTRVFQAPEPESEGQDYTGLKDIQGRLVVKMILDTGGSPAGEGWIHYMYPKPGDIFPAWKSSFVKKVIIPSGKPHIVGSGVYNMQMDKAFIEDIVNRAAQLVEKEGKLAFDHFRDKTGPFYFMDTYVFVLNPEGVELVNPAQPTLEGRNLIDMKDLQGKDVVKEEIAIATKQGQGWSDLYWYQPGDNKPALKHAFVKKVEYKGEIFIIGSGYYSTEGVFERGTRGEIRKLAWKDLEEERMSEFLSRQVLFGEKATIARIFAKRGEIATRHEHPNEEYDLVISGVEKFKFDDREMVVRAGEVLIIPQNVPHSVEAIEDTVSYLFFTPPREDWARGEDKYLRS